MALGDEDQRLQELVLAGARDPEEPGDLRLDPRPLLGRAHLPAHHRSCPAPTGSPRGDPASAWTSASRLVASAAWTRRRLAAAYLNVGCLLTGSQPLIVSS